MIDLDYRPPFYDPSGALAFVRSEARRRLLRKSEAAGDEASSLTEEQIEKLLDETSDEVRAEFTASHPGLMSGEFLPDDDGVEIARLVLASTTGDVIVVLAAEEGGGYQYSVADEYESEFDCPAVQAERTLSLGELVAFLDGVTLSGEGDLFEGRGLVEGFWMRRARQGATPEEATAFVSVTSDVYPGLASYYAARASAWARQS